MCVKIFSFWNYTCLYIQAKNEYHVAKRSLLSNLQHLSNLAIINFCNLSILHALQDNLSKMVQLFLKFSNLIFAKSNLHEVWPNWNNPAGNYMFNVNDRNTRTRCEICSKLTTKTPERRHWHRSGVFIGSFEHISHLVLVFL